MITLVLFEFKRFFKRKKNIIGIILIMLFAVIYIFVNNTLEKQLISSELTSCTFDLNSVKQALTNQRNQYSSDRNNIKMKEIIALYQNKFILLSNKQNAILSNDWKKQLTAEIQLDKASLKNERNGTETGEDPTVISSRLNKNEILLQKNIKPIYETCSMTSYNFLRLAGRDFIPLILITLLFLFSSDSISNELEGGTFKILLIQPISRCKILISKIISYTLICILIVTVTLGSIFLILGFIKGFGSPVYPTAYYTGSFSTFYKTIPNASIKMINIGSFILYMIPFLILLIISIVSISILISIISDSSSTSISLSVLLSVTSYIFIFQLKFLKTIDNLIPFSYTNIPDLLDGTLISEFNNKNMNYGNGVIVLLFYALLCYSLSFILFRNKNIN